MSLADFPHYLTQPERIRLAEALQQYESANYYTSMWPDDLLQGDGWSGLEIINVENGDRDRVKGITLSNSCDIDRTNRRDMPPRVIFAPLVTLQRFRDRLSEAGMELCAKVGDGMKG
jgi:hypothetical protein